MKPDAPTAEWLNAVRRFVANTFRVSLWRVSVTRTTESPSDGPAKAVDVELRIVDDAGTQDDVETPAALVALNWEKEINDKGWDPQLGKLSGLSVQPEPPMPPTLPPQTIYRPPAPPTPPPSPPPRCDATGTAALEVLFDGAEWCGIAETSVGGWRLLLLGISGGGAVLAAVLAVLWFKVLTRAEKEVARGSKAKAGAKEAGEGEGEEAGADGPEGKTQKKKKKKGGIKGAFKAVKAFATHPAVAAWRSTLGGVLDLLTDVVFAFSLWRAAENAQQRALGAAAEAGEAAPGFFASVEAPLAVASTALIATSILFCCGGVLRLYVTMARSGKLSRRLFHMDESGVDKAAFFVLVLLAATVNVRLAALLPWHKDDRSDALKRILKLHTASKVVEDLPQLVLVGVFLVHSSVSDRADGSGAVGAAIVQLVVSGVSFALTLLWLGLQIVDSRRPAATKPDLAGGERSEQGERSKPRRGSARNLVKVETPAPKEPTAGGAAGDDDDESSAMNNDAEISYTEQKITARV